jgi:hypothetical protein
VNQFVELHDLPIHSSHGDRRSRRPIIVLRPRDHRSGQRRR